MDEELKQVMELFVNERLGIFCKKHHDKRKEKFDKADEFLGKLKEKYPELVDDFNNTLDFVVRNNWPDEKNLYFFGFSDAIRLLMSI